MTAGSHAPTLARPLAARRARGLQGVAVVPGDKSISHRALILGSLSVGETRITGLLEAEDVLNTATAMRAFGAEVVRDGQGAWRVQGMGVGGWHEPDNTLDFGNSGTGSRLVMGAMATTAITAVFTGDASLRRRPMARVLDPLMKFGAEYTARDGGLMPLTLRGARRPICVDTKVMVASAQVKSALLLAALGAPGRSRIVQDELTRDHTEKMLAAFGAEIAVEPLPGGGEAIQVLGEVDLKPCPVDVPRDPSSAAFALVAALIVPGSEITLPSILLNPRRTGLIDTLIEMGADIAIGNERTSGGERIGDLVARSSMLKGVEVPPERAPSMIDEYPVLSVAAAFAEGRTVMRGLGELRVKESDRLGAIAAGLKACGLAISETDDSLAVEGRGRDVPGGARVATHLDHRIAMSFLVGGLASRDAISVDDTTMIATSFPEFEPLMRDLGASFSVPNV
jgi:3-phosphoshikimate 1-carboxyvinyltransferase